MLATTKGPESGAKRPTVTAGDAAKVISEGGDHIDRDRRGGRGGCPRTFRVGPTAAGLG